MLNSMQPQSAFVRGRGSGSSATTRRACPAQPFGRASRGKSQAVASATPAAHVVEDKWLAKNQGWIKNSDVPSSLSSLHDASWSALATMRMPTTRNEDYRFTDIAPLLKEGVKPACPAATVDREAIAKLALPEASGSTLVVVNGQLRQDLSRMSGLPKGVYIGSVQGAPAGSAAKLGTLSSARGGPFAALNGAACRDALCVVVPKGVVVDAPIHVLYVSTGGSSAGDREGSAPRLLVDAAEGSAVEVLEEFVAAGSSSGSSSNGSSSNGAGGGHYFNSSVAEVFVAQEAQVSHAYVQREAAQALHFKGTLVLQAANSHYKLTEACVGATLARHDLGIEQAGAATHTRMRHFLICGAGQLHDLHSRLALNHPEGEADQLHKCIVTHSDGKGVFDGNVKVNQKAQKSDAGQLSRNLLLVPRATVNVKPNLQIIADDVKCTHGCAISDLSEEELFYFRARGISAAVARQALVYSFGGEVIQSIKYPALRQRIQDDVSRALSTVDLNAALAEPAEA